MNPTRNAVEFPRLSTLHQHILPATTSFLIPKAAHLVSGMGESASNGRFATSGLLETLLFPKYSNFGLLDIRFDCWGTGSVNG